MKIENSIGWTDATINAVTGCDKVSPGCKNCYAQVGTRARVLRSQGIETWGPEGVRHPVNFAPTFRRLNKLCVCNICHEANQWLDEGGRMKGYQCFFCGGMNSLRRIRLFADSNSDWLDPKWPVETLATFLDAIRLAPNIDVQLLTKRIELFNERLVLARHEADERKWGASLSNWLKNWINGNPPKQIWLGVSVEDQKRADERIPVLIETPAAIRFLSVEPLLEKVTLTAALDPCAKDCRKEMQGEPPFNGHWHKMGQQVSWVIAGGESGRNRRDCGVEAIESVAQQCAMAGVPVYVKQDASLLPGQKGRLSDQTWSFKEFPR